VDDFLNLIGVLDELASEAETSAHAVALRDLLQKNPALAIAAFKRRSELRERVDEITAKMRSDGSTMDDDPKRSAFIAYLLAKVERAFTQDLVSDLHGNRIYRRHTRSTPDAESLMWIATITLYNRWHWLGVRWPRPSIEDLEKHIRPFVERGIRKSVDRVGMVEKILQGALMACGVESPARKVQKWIRNLKQE